MSEHTPGPWNVVEHQMAWGPNPVVEAPTTPVHQPDWIATLGLRVGRDVAQANARLISAAPEMLAALEAFAHWDETAHGTEADASRLRRMIAAAIAKATGKEST